MKFFRASACGRFPGVPDKIQWWLCNVRKNLEWRSLTQQAPPFMIPYIRLILGRIIPSATYPHLPKYHMKIIFMKPKIAKILWFKLMMKFLFLNVDFIMSTLLMLSRKKHFLIMFARKTRMGWKMQIYFIMLRYVLRIQQQICHCNNLTFSHWLNVFQFFHRKHFPQMYTLK